MPACIRSQVNIQSLEWALPGATRVDQSCGFVRHAMPGAGRRAVMPGSRSEIHFRDGVAMDFQHDT